MEIQLDNLFTIGEVSSITQISVRMLRHYDKIDLINPAYVDPDNNYRYYSEEQIMYLSFIKELRNRNFKLSEIKDFFEIKDQSKVVDIYKKKIKEIEKEQEELETAKKRLQDFLEQFEVIFNMTPLSNVEQNEIIKFKEINSRQIIYTRKKTPVTVKDFLTRFAELQNIITENSLQTHGPYMAIYHDDYKELNFLVKDADVEMAIELKENSKFDDNQSYIREIPEGLYLSATYKDGEPLKTTREMYIKMLELVNSSNYEIIGPTIKLYYYRKSIKEGPDKAISELQIQVKKAN